MELDNEKLIQMYTTMIRIRKFEEQLNIQIASGTISGFVHLYLGQEAVATGVCAVLRDSDYISSTHRGHGHLIAKGGKTNLMMAELFAKRTGYCKGKGGSMHIADMDLGIMGANGIVGGGPPLAAGAALAAQHKGMGTVAVSFFGDGASNQGTTHEAMNLASIWKLPVIFVAENNGFGEFTRQSDHQRIRSITERAAGYDMPSASVDGNDAIAVYEAALEAVSRAREGNGPTLLECMTFRIAGHFVGDPEPYRSPDEVTAWKAEDKDPILRFETLLLEKNVCTGETLAGIQKAADDEIADALQFAEESPEPELSDLLEDVYTV